MDVQTRMTCAAGRPGGHEPVGPPPRPPTPPWNRASTALLAVAAVVLTVPGVVLHLAPPSPGSTLYLVELGSLWALALAFPVAVVIGWLPDGSSFVPNRRRALGVGAVVLALAVIPLLDPRGIREAGPISLRGALILIVGVRLGVATARGTGDAWRAGLAFFLLQCSLEAAALNLAHPTGFHWRGSGISSDLKIVHILSGLYAADTLALVAALELALAAIVAVASASSPSSRRWALVAVFLGVMCVAAADPRPLLERHYCGAACFE